MRTIIRYTALATLVTLAGCVGQAAPGPVAYTPGYAPQTGVPAPYPPPPGYAPPQGYAPPPGYTPQAAYAAPGAPAPTAYGSTCYAGVYTCALPNGVPVGSQCSCPGLGAPSFGTVH